MDDDIYRAVRLELDRLRAENERLRELLWRWLASTTDVSSSEAQETIEVLRSE